MEAINDIYDSKTFLGYTINVSYDNLDWYEDYMDEPYSQIYLFTRETSVGSCHSYSDCESLMEDLFKKYFTVREIVAHLHELKTREMTIPQAVAFLNTRIVIKVVSLYSHSGIVLKLGEYFGWDQGPVGIIYTDEKNTIERAGKQLADWRKTAEEYLKDDFEYYKALVDGNIFRWEVLDKDGTLMDTIGGFFGHDCIDNAMSDARKFIASITTEEIKNA